MTRNASSFPSASKRRSVSSLAFSRSVMAIIRLGTWTIKIGIYPHRGDCVITFNLKILTGMKMKITSIGVMTVTALALGCHKPPPIDNKDLRDFQVINLVANSDEYHPKFIDSTLINAFGIAWSPSGIAWVNSLGGHVSELYDVADPAAEGL